MPRLTVKTADHTYETTALADAVNKLGRLEDLCEALPLEQEKIALQLAKLRENGKEKSVQFRELLSKKLTNSLVLGTLQAYQLTDK